MKLDNRLKALPEENYIALPGERLLFLIRRHWLVIFSPLLVLILSTFSFMGIAFVLFMVLFKLTFIFFASAILATGIGLSLGIKIVVDWYFHIYVITSRKIMEISFSPLFSHSINDILLNQVRCTEIDIKISGIITEILDVGDVIVTFDRPTHQEEFIFSMVKNPRWLGGVLSESLDFIKGTQKGDQNKTWYRAKKGGSNYRFAEDVSGGEVN